MSLFRNKVVFGMMIIILSIMVWMVLPREGVPILAYHRIGELPEIYSVKPEDFAAQMEYLEQEGYHAISLAELMEAREEKIKLPSKPIIITFDDGYEDNFSTALPLMEKYGMRGTVFVIPDAVSLPGYLSWEQIKDMKARHTEIGSHTLSHALLRDLSPAERTREVTESKAIIEQQVGGKVEFLAYPFGAFDRALFDILRKAGYRGACTGAPGLNAAHGNTNTYNFRRINIPRPKLGLWEFRLRLFRAEGLWVMGNGRWVISTWLGLPWVMGNE